MLPTSEAKITLQGDKVVLIGKAHIAATAWVWILVILTGIGCALISLKVGAYVPAIGCLMVAVFSGAALLKHERVEFIFEIPNQLVHWEVKHIYKTTKGTVHFSEIQSVQLRQFSSVWMGLGSMAEVTTGLYLILSSASLPIIAGGLTLQKATEYISLLKSHLPMLDFTELEAGNPL